MNRLFLWFVKITGYPIQYFFFRKKVYYESDLSPRKIKGGALIVSNHTSVYDFHLVMYTYLPRTIRPLVAELMFEKSKFMNFFLTGIGCVRVERYKYDTSFIPKMTKYLRKGQVGLVYPEAFVPTTEEELREFLPFKPSYIYIALESGVPLIPVYTNGIYGKDKKKKKSHAKIIIGNPIDVVKLYDDNKTEKENIEWINNYVRDYIKNLRNILESGK